MVYACRMVTKGRHPKNEINAVFKALDQSAFDIVEDHNGHRWGFVVCKTCGQSRRINSTPRNPGNEANHIRQFGRQHNHQGSK